MRKEAIAGELRSVAEFDRRAEEFAMQSASIAALVAAGRIPNSAVAGLSLPREVLLSHLVGLDSARPGGQVANHGCPSERVHLVGLDSARHGGLKRVRVLELGGGFGRDAVEIARAGCEVRMLDGSTCMCALATKSAVKAGVSSRFEACQALFSALPPLGRDAASYDGVLLFTVLTHTPWRIAPLVVQYAHDALALGGVLVIAEPLYREDQALHATRTTGHMEAGRMQETRSWPEWRKLIGQCQGLQLLGRRNFNIAGAPNWSSEWRKV